MRYTETGDNLSQLVREVPASDRVSPMSDAQSQLDHLAELYLAILGLLKSRVISLSVRSNLELYREGLEQEIARLKERQRNDLAA